MEIAAAAIGVVNVTIRAGSKAWMLSESWKDAPKEIHNLRDSLDRAQDLFAQVRLAIEKARIDELVTNPLQEASLRRLGTSLSQGFDAVSDIEAIVQKILDGKAHVDRDGRIPESLSKRRRIVWMVEADKLARLRAVLKDISMMVCGSLISLNVIVSMELLPSLVESERMVISHIHDSQFSLAQRINQSQTDTVARIEKRLEDMSGQIMSRMDTSTLMPGLLVQPGKPKRLRRSHQDNTIATSRINQPLNQMDSLFLASASSRGVSVMNRWSKASYARCKSFCACQCHRQPSPGQSGARGFASRWELRYFEKTFGSATLDYFGFLTRRKSCNDRNCQSHRVGEIVRFHYQFPAWILNIAVCLYFSTRLFGSPELLLRVCNIIPEEGSTISMTIFGFLYRKDYQGVKSILEERPSAVCDIRASRGTTPLYYAVEYGDITLVRLLLQAGADPHQEANKLRSPIKHALEKFEAGDEGGKQLAEVFPLADHLQDDDAYTILHRIILGLVPKDLEKELIKPSVREVLEVPSYTGFTPLQLAARRGNTQATALLLTAGADVTASKPDTGWMPIHEAASMGFSAVVHLLLENDSDVHARAKNGDTPLIVTAAHSGCVKTMSVLLHHGADIDSLGSNPYRLALVMAIAAQNTSAIDFLLEHGINIDDRDADRDTALIAAAFYRDPRTSSLLLARGADYNTINNYGHNVLHALALCGNVETMAVFAKARMVGPDTTRVDNSGKTPRELFDWRRDINEGPESLALRRAFDELMASVGQEELQEDSGVEFDSEFGGGGGGGGGGVRDREDSKEDEEFFDAMEHF